ncbi:MAG: CPBP family intramembrane metalloprotease [Acetatifactor sp.]|nr:CPBP family intramembrane metalloprotease [Acetatifactor sp.]
MKKLYEKSELTFAIVWIVIYCVLQSLANSINEKIGTPYSASAILCVLQAVVLFFFIWKNGLLERYGLCKSSVPARRFLYYVPLIILATGNLWNGVAVNYPLADTICHIVCMLCVGFVEEVIFRGFLFKAMAKNNVKSAIIVSSVTFGIGHLVNLFNGSGMDLVNNLCQISFAVAVGFLFVMVFYRSKSLLPCIITHSAINTLNTFSNGAGVTVEKQIIHSLIMIVLSVVYTLILTKTLPKKQ